MKETLLATAVGFATVMSEALAADPATALGLVPIPKEISFSRQKTPNALMLDANTRILYDAKSAGACEAAEFLVSFMVEDAGLKLTSAPAPAKQSHDKNIVFRAKTGMPTEGYELRTGPGVTIEASGGAGFFYGAQTLRQMLTRDAATGKPAIPVGITIMDEPRFAWRGLMIDCCRHFFTVEELKKMLDLMASLKLNTFHWHLTEDQAWRIEIKKYPKLTEIGAWRGGVGFDLPSTSTDRYRADGKYGGFYTQEQAKEIIKYAAARHINVTPEIEMPGHSTAALVVYPEFGCTGGPYAMPAGGGIFLDVYCAGNDKTIAFLEDVLTEIADLFPSKFVHIGGDECPKDRWTSCAKCQQRIRANGLKDEKELQSWFVRRMDKFLESKGKRLIGWDEILEGGLAPGAAVMSWRGVKGGIEAASAGHDVVMSPTTHCYFDYLQAKTGEPVGIGGFLPLEKVYEFDPVTTGIPEAKRQHVLGGQANVWTEHIPNARKLQYMTAPRVCALAEAVWSPADKRNWADFRARMDREAARLDAMGINYRKLDK
ncbi:MAG: beta-N-acetylhexosaminidase [bacterium]|nr:beta-N-acetylhexosaminidase [Candidatus Sumerlaeota bacterium]